MLPPHPILFLLLLLFSSLPGSHQSQPSYQCDESFTFINSTIMTKNLTHCKKLRALGAELGWNQLTTTNTTNNNNTTMVVNIVFSAKAPTPTGWIAWGVNPGPRPQMVGTRALIAIGQSNGAPVVGTYNVSAYTKRGCRLENSSIEVGVENVRSEYSGESGVMTVWATVRLPPAYNVSRLNHVWQVGARAAGLVPKVHGMRLENFDSVETIDLTTGRHYGHDKEKLRAAHGILSVTGWGFLLPLGVIVSRYFKSFPFPQKRWFLVHVSIQISAYSIGTAAWGIGLSLISDSQHYKSFMPHRIIGIMIFCLATLQMMALWLKPNRGDKYRKYWSIYHHFVGYALVALTIVNIFKGLSILRPPTRWKWGYIGILISLSCVALGLETTSWVKFCLAEGPQHKVDRTQTQSKGS